jgi:hypothetical protein
MRDGHRDRGKRPRDCRRVDGDDTAARASSRRAGNGGSVRERVAAGAERGGAVQRVRGSTSGPLASPPRSRATRGAATTRTAASTSPGSRGGALTASMPCRAWDALNEPAFVAGARTTLRECRPSRSKGDARPPPRRPNPRVPPCSVVRLLRREALEPMPPRSSSHGRRSAEAHPAAPERQGAPRAARAGAAAGRACAGGLPPGPAARIGVHGSGVARDLGEAGVDRGAAPERRVRDLLPRAPARSGAASTSRSPPQDRTSTSPAPAVP